MSYTLQQLQQMGYQTGGSSAPPKGSSGNTYTYQQLMNMGYKASPGTGSFTPDQSAATLGHANGLLGNVISGAWGGLTDVATGAAKQVTSDVMGLGGLGQKAESAIGGAIGLTPKQSGSESAFNPQSEAGQKAAQITQPTNFLQKLGGLFGTAAEIATPLGEEKTATKAGEFLAKNADAKATQTAVKALTPKMTPTEVKDAAAAGKATVSKLAGAKLNLTKDTGFMKIVNDVKGLVKGKSAIEDINSVRSALSTEASALRDKVVQSGKDIIYPFKELAAKISSAEEPLSLKGTPFEKQIVPLKNAVMQMAQKAGGKVSSLLDVRQEFDTLVDKTWPNLYESENAPMRNAVTSVRDAMNTFIKDNLPKEVGYIESLGKQTNFYRAIDNLVTKVPDELKNSKGIIGVGKEIGKKALNYGAKAIGAGLLYEGAKDVGAPLP